ncbi:MAG: amidohydrolase family protein [Opitutales bacterium]
MRIDADIQVPTPANADLKPWLPATFVDYIDTSGYQGPDCDDFPDTAAISWREDVPKSFDAAWLADHLNSGTVTDLAILRSGFRPESIHQPDLALASARAANAWLAESWLSMDSRFRGSLVVPSQHPEMAAPLVEEQAADERFVQVELPVRSREPYGNRRYWPLFRVAAARGLVICLTPGGSPGNPPTPSGWPATYMEEVTDFASVFQAQVVSLIFEGAFAEIPDLRVVLAGSGVTWLPALCWRFDKEWKGLRQHTPWVQDPPSAHVRDRIRLTTTPFDGPDDQETVRSLIHQLPAKADNLLWGSALPRNYARPAGWLPACLVPTDRQTVAGANARSWYPRLGAFAPAADH